MISDDGLNVIKTTSYSEDVSESNQHVVMSKVEGYCIGEVNKFYERYCIVWIGTSFPWNLWTMSLLN